MQSRVAIILSLGMLLEKVDTSGFSAKMLKKAEENPEFQFTQLKQQQAFLIIERFNQGKLEPEVFEKQITQLLEIKNLASIEFWSAWNDIVTVGHFSEKIQLLREMSQNYQALIYLSSDTNLVHLKKVEQELEEQKMSLKTQNQSITLEQFPLYASCKVGENREQLTKHIVSDIQSKEANKPSRIHLILGDPDNIKDKNHQAIAKKECDSITAWCHDHDVSVSLHHQSLEETLTKILAPEVKMTETRQYSF